jgi:hypothetical protein
MRYVDRYRAGGEGIEAFIGKCVHRVVELDHKGGLPFSGPTALWDTFNSIFNRDYDPKKVHDARDRGTEHWRGHGMKCVSNYARVGRLDPGHELIGVEKKLGMPLLKSPLCTFIGIMDRLVRVGESYEIHDFKSGKVKTRDQFIADHQLPLYAMLVANEYGLSASTPFLVKRIYLAEGRVEPFLVEPARRGAALLWAQNTAIKALDVEDEYRKTREVEANRSPLCNWCGYKQRYCPIWQVSEVA